MLSIIVVVTGTIITVLLGTDGSKKTFGSDMVIGKVGQLPSVVFCPALEAANTRTTNMPIRSDCNPDLLFMIFPRLVLAVVFSDRRNREPSFNKALARVASLPADSGFQWIAESGVPAKVQPPTAYSVVPKMR